jgi:hypothetical protein
MDECRYNRRGSRRVIQRVAVAVAALCCAHAALADDAPADAAVAWSPISTTSVSITGPITLSPESLTAYGAIFPLRLTARVKAFHSDDGARPASIFAVTQPTNPPLLNGNRLCGDQAATWLVSVDRAPGQLELIVATGSSSPKREESPTVCGIYYYARR